MRQVCSDFKMVVAEGDTCCNADVLHDECRNKADSQENQSIVPAIGQGCVRAGDRNSNGRQTLGKRRWIPCEADHQGEIDGEGDPRGDLKPQNRTRPAGFRYLCYGTAYSPW